MTLGYRPPTAAERDAAREARHARIACQMPSQGRIHRGTFEGGTHASVPKGEPARPGKRAQTAAESRWIAAIVAYGCVACHAEALGYVAPEVHHILRGGVRMGHLYAIGLCAGHHRDGAGRPGLVARHPHKARFEGRYGSEWDLLGYLRDEIGVERISAVQKGVDREIARHLG